MAAVALFLIAFISSLSSYFINQQFKLYITKQQQAFIHELIYSLGQQYDTETKSWNVDTVHTIGMYALYDGYILKVYDEMNQSVWDAEVWDMSTCIQIKDDITHSMLSKFPDSEGKFSSVDYSIVLSSTQIGRVNISYYGPYFYSENDFDFLNRLSSILLLVGLFALLLSLILGYIIARRISKPILTTIKATEQISKGEYKIRINEQSKLTEVDHLIESVNQLAVSLDKQESLKKKLTTDVAHELRTPLTTLRLNIEAMIEGLIEPSTERLKSSHEEILRIASIVTDLEKLTIIEDENLKLDKTEVDLMALSQQVVHQLQRQITEKEMVISIKGFCSKVRADASRMTQVLINLLTNALKYTPNQGMIDIVLSENEREVILSVVDNVSGIEEEDLPYIFERFYRADKSRNRLTGGSGIGLTIVKSIVLAHGGHIDVQSEIGKGSTFSVSLPK